MGDYPSANGIQSARVGAVSKRGDGRGLNALIFTLGSGCILESRLSGEEEEREDCVLVTSNANIDKTKLDQLRQQFGG